MKTENEIINRIETKIVDAEEKLKKYENKESDFIISIEDCVKSHIILLKELLKDGK